MYHIQEDKRAQKSAALVLQALRQCLGEKDYDAVTISDICRVSTVSRATFYRLFDCKDDVLAWGLDIFFENFCTNIQGRSIREKLESYLAAWMGNPQALELAIRIQRRDVPDASYHKRVSLMERYFVEMELTATHVAVLSSAMTALLTTWVRTGRKETPDELAEAFLSVLRDLNGCFSKG